MLYAFGGVFLHGRAGDPRWSSTEVSWFWYVESLLWCSLPLSLFASKRLIGTFKARHLSHVLLWFKSRQLCFSSIVSLILVFELHCIHWVQYSHFALKFQNRLHLCLQSWHPNLALWLERRNSFHFSCITVTQPFSALYYWCATRNCVYGFHKRLQEASCQQRNYFHQHISQLLRRLQVQQEPLRCLLMRLPHLYHIGFNFRLLNL